MLLGKRLLVCVLLTQMIISTVVYAENYRRVSLESIYRITRNGNAGSSAIHDISDDENVLVVGSLLHDSSESRWLLTGQMGGCCAFFTVGIPLRETHTFSTGDWVAVYGQLNRHGPELTSAMIDEEARQIFLGGDDLGIVVHRMVPAVNVLYTNSIYTLLNGENMKRFRHAIDTTQLKRDLQSVEGITIFVPHDAAFDRTDLPDDPDQLRHFLYGHMVKERLSNGDLRKRKELVMMNGDRHAIEIINGRVQIGGSRMLFKDMKSLNGIAHSIMPALDVSP